VEASASSISAFVRQPGSLLLWRQTNLYLLGDCPGHLTVQRQNMARFPVIAVGPKMALRRRFGSTVPRCGPCHRHAGQNLP
jgi:hypothetical protein